MNTNVLADVLIGLLKRNIKLEVRAASPVDPEQAKELAIDAILGKEEPVNVCSFDCRLKRSQRWAMVARTRDEDSGQIHVHVVEMPNEETGHRIAKDFQLYCRDKEREKVERN